MLKGDRCQELPRPPRLAVYIGSWPAHRLRFASDSVKLYLLRWRQPPSSHLVELWHPNNRFKSYICESSSPLCLDFSYGICSLTQRYGSTVWLFLRFDYSLSFKFCCLACVVLLLLNGSTVALFTGYCNCRPLLTACWQGAIIFCRKTDWLSVCCIIVE